MKGIKKTARFHREKRKNGRFKTVEKKKEGTG